MSVYPDVKDEDGLLASCRAGRAIGLFGRTAIHPRQIPAIRRAFRPGEEETARAVEIVAAAEQAERDGAGAIALPDGRFVDAPPHRHQGPPHPRTRPPPRRPAPPQDSHSQDSHSQDSHSQGPPPASAPPGALTPPGT
ncbi:hypothetical protein [Nonomuraea salmonea]|uniref:hypothetical protein n=1 Tax=Nonomuraea salmonea TaxID=46181 RepID=UPI002FE88483